MRNYIPKRCTLFNTLLFLSFCVFTSFVYAQTTEYWPQTIFDKDTGTYSNTEPTADNESVKLSGHTFSHISAGDSHSIGIKPDGTLWAWGYNGHGELGIGNTTTHLSPVQVGTDTNWKELSVAGYHNIAIKTDGTLWAWGMNTYGQLGLGDTVNRLLPVQVGVETDWKSISAGGSYPSYGHCLALKNNDTLWAWGSNRSGQLGLGDVNNRSMPVQVGTDTWKEITAGFSHSLAIRNDNSLWAWGLNSYGQLGLNDTLQRNSPARVGYDTDWQKVSAGSRYTIALKSNNTLYACGWNFYGQLGLGYNYDRWTPTQVTGTDWKTISAGAYHAMAIKTNGKLYAWGRNYYGQLGLGDTVNRNIPTQVGSDNNWQMVDGGDYSHTLATRTDRGLWVWGDNWMGELGLGDTSQRNSPVQVTGFTSGTYTTPEIIPASGISSWRNLTYNCTLPAFAILTVDVIYGNGNVLTNVTSGADLSGLLGGYTGSIKLRANLATTNSAVTPLLNDWIVYYDVMVLPPAAPTNLVATAVSHNQINLTWQDNSDNENGFIIEGKVNCFSDFVQIAKVGANTTTYSDKRALAGITHFYRVKAYNEAGDSAYSNIASATTPTPMDDILAALSRFYQEGAIKNAGLYNSLLVKLQAAQNAQNVNAALNKLNAFSNQVEAQSGKGITTEASQTLLALNVVTVAYINPDKIAYDYALIATFKPIDYSAVKIEARETPEPYVPFGPNDNAEYVFEGTRGILRLYYYDNAGQCINIDKEIGINNVTRVIYYNDASITTLREIFGELLPTPAGDTMYLVMDFHYPIGIFMTPVSNNQTQPQIPQFQTDGKTKIITVPDGFPWPPPAGVPVPPWYTEDYARDRTITDANKTVAMTVTLDSTIITITIGTLISRGIITPTAIPTDSYNCHGWTFACGQGWVTVRKPPLQAEGIISANGYAPITDTHMVHVGALATYGQGDPRSGGVVSHTGIVREVQRDGTRTREYCQYGTPTLVESKWGRNGQYLHPPDIVDDTYLPPDDPNTPEDERNGGIKYWDSPNRLPPPGSTDPGKAQHTLKPIPE